MRLPLSAPGSELLYLLEEGVDPAGHHLLLFVPAMRAFRGEPPSEVVGGDHVRGEPPQHGRPRAARHVDLKAALERLSSATASAFHFLPCSPRGEEVAGEVPGNESWVL